LALGAAQGAWKYLLHAGGGQGAAGRFGQIGCVAFLTVAVPNIYHDLAELDRIRMFFII
jgi:hypothetical protein